MEPNPAEVATLAQLACLLEVSASKPGNVAPGRRFRDMGYEDFLVSALAIGPAIAAAGSAPLGTTIRSALEATRRRTRANTNLGMVLLLAPIARAALLPADAADLPLRARLRRVLSETTVEDAVETYAAIREAAPGGMGRSELQDLSTRPTVTLTEAMRLAAERDAVAREYVTEFALTFECGLPALTAALAAGLDWGTATVQTFLAILARSPDTLIARKLGNEAAAAVSRRAAEVQAAGGAGSQAGREALAQFDAALRDRQNTFNPGTTADLTAATLFVALLERAAPDSPRESLPSDFRVSVSKDYLVFSSAHFITLRGHQCETLHGHNYRVGVRAEGSIDAECLFVIDFSIIKKMVRTLVDRIDHKVLLATLNPKLEITEQGGKVHVASFGAPTYIFPKGDCALIPIQNTTAEMLAQHLAEQLKADLAAAGVTNLTALELEVEENFGQSATYRLGV